MIPSPEVIDASTGKPLVRGSSSSNVELYNKPGAAAAHDFRSGGGGYVVSKSFYEYGGEGIPAGQGAKLSGAQANPALQNQPGVRKVTQSYGTPLEQEKQRAVNIATARREGQAIMKKQESAYWIKDLSGQQQISKAVRGQKTVYGAIKSLDGSTPEKTIMLRSQLRKQNTLFVGSGPLTTNSVTGQIDKNLSVRPGDIKDYKTIYRRENKEYLVQQKFKKNYPVKYRVALFGKAALRGVPYGVAGYYALGQTGGVIGGATGVISGATAAPYIGFGVLAVAGTYAAYRIAQDRTEDVITFSKGARQGGLKQGMENLGMLQKKRSDKAMAKSDQLIQGVGMAIGAGLTYAAFGKMATPKFTGSYTRGKPIRVIKGSRATTITKSAGQYRRGLETYSVKVKSVSKEKILSAGGSRSTDQVTYKLYSGRGEKAKLLGTTKRTYHTDVDRLGDYTRTYKGKTVEAGNIAALGRGKNRPMVISKGLGKDYKTISVGKQDYKITTKTPGAGSVIKERYDFMTSTDPTKAVSIGEKFNKQFTKALVKFSKDSPIYITDTRPRGGGSFKPTGTGEVKFLLPEVSKSQTIIKGGASLIPKTLVPGSSLIGGALGGSFGIAGGLVSGGAGLTGGIAQTGPKEISIITNQNLTGGITGGITRPVGEVIPNTITPVSGGLDYTAPAPAIQEPIINYPSVGSPVFIGGAVGAPIVPGPQVPPPGIPLPSLPPAGGFDSFGKAFRKKTKQSKGYTPSATALAFGITGKPSKAGAKTGLGLRPIPKGKKKQRFKF